jgi:hypothetical protein
MRIVAEETFGERGPVEHGHTHIRDQEIDSTTGVVRPFDCFSAISGIEYLVAFSLKDGTNERTHRSVVIHHENRLPMPIAGSWRLAPSTHR